MTYLSIFVFAVSSYIAICRIFMQKIKDWQLALGVLTLVLADLTILLVYTVVEGIQGNLTVDLIPNKEKPMSVDGVR